MRALMLLLALVWPAAAQAEDVLEMYNRLFPPPQGYPIFEQWRQEEREQLELIERNRQRQQLDQIERNQRQILDNQRREQFQRRYLD